MTIKVLGSGCSTCKKLYELTKQAVSELGIKTNVEYITDIEQILKLGVMQSPVLAINNAPVMVGYLPDIDRIKELIKENSDGPI